MTKKARAQALGVYENAERICDDICKLPVGGWFEMADIMEEGIVSAIQAGRIPKCSEPYSQKLLGLVRAMLEAKQFELRRHGRAFTLQRVRAYVDVLQQGASLITERTFQSATPTKSKAKAARSKGARRGRAAAEVWEEFVSEAVRIVTENERAEADAETAYALYRASRSKVGGSRGGIRSASSRAKNRKYSTADYAEQYTQGLAAGKGKSFAAQCVRAAMTRDKRKPFARRSIIQLFDRRPELLHA